MITMNSPENILIMENVKFDLNFQWRLYLRRVGLKESQLQEDQLREMKRTFYGACGQVLMVFVNDLSNLSDEKGVEMLDSMVKQVGEFWSHQE